MKPIRKTASVLLTVSLLAAALASCNDNTGTAEKPIDNSVSASDAETVGAERSADNEDTVFDTLLASFPDVDYGGSEFRILDRSAAAFGIWATRDVYAEGENGDPINDAVFKRNSMLEEKFNIRVKELWSSGEDVSATAAKAVQAGDDAYDLVTDGLSDIVPLTAENLFLDLNSVPGLKLDQPWWDQPMRIGFSVLGRSYIMTGDISMMDNDGTWCILFNKSFIDIFDLDDPYQLVRDGKWTLDVMYGMAKTVSADTNGDSRMDMEDRWGLLTEIYNIYVLWTGGQNQIASLDKDGIPEFTLSTERASDTYDKVLEMMFDPKVTSVVGYGSIATFEDRKAVFSGDRALFLHSSLSDIVDRRSSDTDFGVLPSPKFDEAQETYQNSFSSFNMTAYGIPTTVSDPDRVGILTESMAELSQYTLTPAYYDITLMGKSVRDNESEEMIDLILHTRCYDIGLIYQWGNTFAMLTSGDRDSIGTYMSQVERGRKRAEKMLDQFIDKLKAME